MSNMKEVRKIKVALIKFKGYQEFMEYSYFTDIDNLKEGDVVVVPTNNFYSVGVFSRYSSNKQHIKNAEKVIVEKVDIEKFENKMFLGL
jgi:sortase (surface protein transpeptidase)